MSCHHEHSLQSSEAGTPLRAAMPMLHEAASAGRASASRWAPVFDSDSSENLRPVFIPVACDYAHALGECSGCEHGPLRRYQLLCRPSGLSPFSRSRRSRFAPRLPAPLSALASGRRAAASSARQVAGLAFELAHRQRRSPRPGSRRIWRTFSCCHPSCSVT